MVLATRLAKHHDLAAGDAEVILGAGDLQFVPCPASEEPDKMSAYFLGPLSLPPPEGFPVVLG